MRGQIGRQEDRKAGRETDTQAGGKTGRWKDRKAGRETNRQGDRHSCNMTGRQASDYKARKQKDRKHASDC